MSTCDHICRECGGVMNCQHCRPYQLPVDRARIAELEEVLDDIFVHGSVGPTPDWMMVPRVEWDQAVQRAKLKPR